MKKPSTTQTFIIEGKIVQVCYQSDTGYYVTINSVPFSLFSEHAQQVISNASELISTGNYVNGISLLVTIADSLLDITLDLLRAKKEQIEDLIRCELVYAAEDEQAVIDRYIQRVADVFQETPDWVRSQL